MTIGLPALYDILNLAVRNNANTTVYTVNV